MPRSLLLAQAVGVLAGEARDERRLAVVDVAGGAEGQRRTVAATPRLRCSADASGGAGEVLELVLADGAQVEEQAAVVDAADDGRRAAAQQLGARVGLGRGHRGRDGDARHLGDRQRAGAGAGDRLDELETVLGHAGADRAASRSRSARAAHVLERRARAPPASGSRRWRAAGRGRAAARRRARRGRACRCAGPAPADGGASPRRRRPGRRRCRPAGRRAACRR